AASCDDRTDHGEAKRTRHPYGKPRQGMRAAPCESERDETEHEPARARTRIENRHELEHERECEPAPAQAALGGDEDEWRKHRQHRTELQIPGAENARKACRVARARDVVTGEDLH